MSEEMKWQFELEEYIRQGEPGQIEKSEAWQTAIGLQAVDGLKTSAYLLDTAKERFRYLADKLQKSGIIKNKMAKLKEKGYIRRVNGKRNGAWEVMVDIID